MEIKEIVIKMDEPLIEYTKRYSSHPEIMAFVESYNDISPFLRQETDFCDAAKLENHTAGAVVLERERKNGDIIYMAGSYGFGLKLFERMGFNVTGIDIDKAAVIHCRIRGLEMVLGDATQLPFANESADITLSKDFLREDYHGYSLSPILRSLREQYRILRQGGIAVSYSALFSTFLDKDNSSYYDWAEYGLIPVTMLVDLPFKELRRYQIDFAGYDRELPDMLIRKFVDVFQK